MSPDEDAALVQMRALAVAAGDRARVQLIDCAISGDERARAVCLRLVTTNIHDLRIS